MSQEFDSDILDLAKQTGFYPYEYMSSFDKFKERLSIKENFYSSLIGKKISDKEYKNAIKVLDRFKMITVKDDHDLYLKSEGLLLADVFEKFRDSSLRNYGLCPSHYLSASALNWDAMLTMTKAEL